MGAIPESFSQEVANDINGLTLIIDTFKYEVANILDPISTKMTLGEGPFLVSYRFKSISRNVGKKI